uniref:DUF7788 domain-containing protein n=1 Tax=Populus alba TaxID=43335 RepID=A0A4U5QAA3_POPAL|nr:hypothetical protein D5086_0000116220 [Populus alba]
MYFVKSMDLGMNTNFKTVSDIILQAAVKGKSRVYLTIKRVSVFSDMEFDQASTNIWETGYQDCEEVDSKGKEMRMDRKRFHDVVPGEDCLDFSQYLDSMIVLLTRCHDVLSGVSLRKPILLPDSELSDRISELHSLQIISTTFLFSAGSSSFNRILLVLTSGASFLARKWCAIKWIFLNYNILSLWRMRKD